MLVASILLLFAPLAAAAADCGSGGLWGSNCAPSVTNTGSSVEIGAVYEEPGTGGGGTSDGGFYESDDISSTEDSGSQPGGGSGCTSSDPLCRDSNYVVVMIPTATLSDLASFAPVSTPVSGEPGGFGIVGMPVNFIAEAGEHTASGELFDMPVTVRFIPVGFVFDHGDGTSRAASTGGASWTALGLPQFSATPTSHAYAERGEYAAAVTVQYEAAVDFGTGWRPVAGLLELTGPASTVTVLQARTALVEATCLERPTGPGC